MKIFDIVRSLTRKISNIFNDLVSPGLLGQKKVLKIKAERIKKGWKVGKKRPTFNSFLKEHDSSAKSASIRIKKKSARTVAKNQGPRQFKKLTMN